MFEGIINHIHYEDVLEFMDYIMAEKRLLKRDNLKIFFLDYQLDDNKSFGDYYFQNTHRHLFW
jgi:hypothetical protein